MHCVLLVGQKVAVCGRGVVHAKHLAMPENGKEPKMKDTYGPKCDDSSRNVSLQQSLESKLRQRLEGTGSPLYALTSKHWAMKSGAPIFAVRASARRISGNGCTGWQTPRAKGDAGGNRWETGDTRNLEDQVRYYTVGWPTAKASARRISGNGCTGWPTPTARDHKDGNSPSVVASGRTDVLSHAVFTTGPTSSTSPAETEKPGQLCPEFVCWLMGFPTEWVSCGVSVMRSSRKSPRRSSVHS